ncbi:MAG TPA: glycoside hydrolase family 88 protein, partial [Anaerolineae bacterium]
MSHEWHYENGVMLKAIERVWQKSGEAKYFQFIHDTLDQFIEPDGNIRTYRLMEYNLDQINMGKALFPVWRATGDERYKRAAFLLREQLIWQPRTREGGFWHKHIYPYQMWLDGIYMGCAFLAEFAEIFNEPGAFDEVAFQIVTVEKHMRDPKTGLLYHGWDESKK